MAFFKQSDNVVQFSCFYHTGANGSYSGVFHQMDARNAQRLGAIYRATTAGAQILCVFLLAALLATVLGARVPQEWVVAAFAFDSMLILPALLLPGMSRKVRLSDQAMQIDARPSVDVYKTAILVPFNYCMAIALSGVTSPLLVMFYLTTILVVAGAAWRLRQIRAKG